MPRAALASAPDALRYRSLTGRDDFSKMYQEGVRSRRGGVTVVGTPGVPGPPLVGVVAGKRVGNAVRRNRAKRRLRGALREAPLRSGWKYVVIAGPEVPDVDYGRLQSWVAAAIDGVSVGETKENE